MKGNDQRLKFKRPQVLDLVDPFWRDAMVVEMDETRAASLAFQHGLSGFGAVQLAGALTAHDAAGGEALAFS